MGTPRDVDYWTIDYWRDGGNIGGKDSKWMTEVAELMSVISMNKSTEISLAFEI